MHFRRRKSRKMRWKPQAIWNIKSSTLARTPVEPWRKHTEEQVDFWVPPVGRCSERKREIENDARFDSDTFRSSHKSDEENLLATENANSDACVCVVRKPQFAHEIETQFLSVWKEFTSFKCRNKHMILLTSRFCCSYTVLAMHSSLTSWTRNPQLFLI